MPNANAPGTRSRVLTTLTGVRKDQLRRKWSLNTYATKHLMTFAAIADFLSQRCRTSSYCGPAHQNATTRAST